MLGHCIICPPNDNVDLKLIDSKITNISDLVHVFSKEQERHINKQLNVNVYTIPHLNYLETTLVATTKVKELVNIQKKGKKILFFFGRLRNLQEYY